jgi:hypothetical protein
MRLSTRGKVVKKNSASAGSASREGAVEKCEKTLSSFEREADGLLEKFVSELERGKGFAVLMDKIESQLASAKRKLDSSSEFELNENAVLADKLSEDIATAASMEDGARLNGVQEEWVEGFESLRKTLDRLSSHVKKMKQGAKHPGSGVLEARNALLAFARDERICRKRMDGLVSEFGARKGGQVTQVNSARKRLELLRSSIGKKSKSLVRTKLKGKVSEAKNEIIAFMERTHEGRIIVDHKHLTIYSGTQRMRVPLTEAVRFSLEEIAPIEKPLSKIGRVVLVGSYGKENGRKVLAIGERSLVGDSIVLTQNRYEI